MELNHRSALHMQKNRGLLKNVEKLDIKRISDMLKR
jgi:hypothetical protein